MSRIGIGKHWSAAAAGRFLGCLYAVLIGFFAVGSPQARAADHIRVATLKTTEAGKIALKGGAADVIVSDWLWVARERSLGDNLMFYPYSTALGAVMVAADAPTRSLGDLKGKKLGVAGGPLDKSWLLLRASALRCGRRRVVKYS